MNLSPLKNKMSHDSPSRVRSPKASPGATLSIVPVNTICIPAPLHMQRSFDDSWFHLFINDRASSGEIMFLQLASTCNLAEAIFWARKLGWNYKSAIRKSIRLLTKRGLPIPPPLQESLAKFGERGKSCT